MNRTLASFLALTLLGAAPPGDEASKKDLAKLQGDWAAVSMVVDGTKSSDDEAQSLFRTVKGNAYTLALFNKTLARYTFKIDASKNPKTIDATPVGGLAQGKPALGIYKLEGDRWTVCFATAGKARPKEFSAKEGSGRSLMVWEREKK